MRTDCSKVRQCVSLYPPMQRNTGRRMDFLEHFSAETSSSSDAVVLAGRDIQPSQALVDPGSAAVGSMGLIEDKVHAGAVMPFATSELDAATASLWQWHKWVLDALILRQPARLERLARTALTLTVTSS